MRVITAGSRTVTEFSVLEQVMEYNNLNKIIYPVLEIVSGGARGADYLGELYAKKHNILLKVFPALWGMYGKSAGYKRNVTMAENADGLVALWDGVSKGTKHMVDIAVSRKIPVILAYVKPTVQSVEKIVIL